MTARVALLGEAAPGDLARAIEAARSHYGEIIACVYGEAKIAPTGFGVTLSRYEREPDRDRVMLDGATLAIVLDGRPDGFAAPLETWRLPSIPVRPVAPAPVAAPTPAPVAAPKPHAFLWLDLETTGLDPATGLVLEFAAVLCEDGRGDDFAVVQQFAGVIHHDAAALAAVQIDDFVRRMHTANGLWRDVDASTTTLAEADAFLAALAGSLTTRKHAIVLAGNTIAFDRKWCERHLPAFAAPLSHRTFDVRTLQLAVDAWAPTPVAWPQHDAHRALADIMQSIDYARAARRAMGWAP